MTNSTFPNVVTNCDCSGGSTHLPLPKTLADTLEGAELKRVNMILLEYARDVTVLQSRAYEAVLKAVAEPR